MNLKVKRFIIEIYILLIIFSSLFIFNYNNVRLTYVNATLPMVKIEGENYKILQISDLHIYNDYSYKDSQFVLINQLIFKTNPNLIILTGDNVVGNNSDVAMKNLGVFINQYNIPWTFVFGNHDAEVENNKQELADIGKTFTNCLFKDGPKDIDGIGNHILNITRNDNSILMSIVLFDSNMYSRVGHFDNVHDNQVNWYINSIEELSKGGNIIKSLVFMHIPFTEYLVGYNSIGIDTELLYGQMVINNSAWYEESKIFNTILELNSTKGVFCGHLHENNCSILYQGVRLTFANTANPDGDQYGIRGGTLISIDDEGEFDVEPVLYN